MKDILLQLIQIMFWLAPLAALVGLCILIKGNETNETKLEELENKEHGN
jgi:hypothetical protein